ncbi:MAG: signal peptidase I [Holosporaceae bacterium]|jgi:signal peptidase I|nr:signal peptidase I [Holosporaceae bacterium]
MKPEAPGDGKQSGNKKSPTELPTTDQNSSTEQSATKNQKSPTEIQPTAENQKSSKQQLKEDLRFIVIFVFFFSLFRFFVYDWYIVPSSSMVPGLLIGDMPFVEKFTYGFSKHSIWFSPNLFSGRLFFRNNVKRGEVIVFKHPKDERNPENEDINLIKRVIALPGDRISVGDGIIRVNGIPAKLTFKHKMAYRDTHAHRFHELSLYEEVLPLSDAPPHTVAYLDEMKFSDANNFQEVTVPPGHYFVMGDNRDCSKDSRCGLGFVPEENLMGRAWFVVYSIDNGVKLWEFWRWFQNIRYKRLLRRII